MRFQNVDVPLDVRTRDKCRCWLNSLRRSLFLTRLRDRTVREHWLQIGSRLFIGAARGCPCYSRMSLLLDSVLLGPVSEGWPGQVRAASGGEALYGARVECQHCQSSEKTLPDM